MKKPPNYSKQHFLYLVLHINCGCIFHAEKLSRKTTPADCSNSPYYRTFLFAAVIPRQARKRSLTSVSSSDVPNKRGHVHGGQRQCRESLAVLRRQRQLPVRRRHGLRCHTLAKKKQKKNERPRKTKKPAGTVVTSGLHGQENFHQLSIFLIQYVLKTILC